MPVYTVKVFIRFLVGVSYILSGSYKQQEFGVIPVKKKKRLKAQKH